MIIADTSAILASIDASAADHQPRAHLVQHDERPLLVSHMVVPEVDDLTRDDTADRRETAPAGGRF